MTSQRFDWYNRNSKHNKMPEDHNLGANLYWIAEPIHWSIDL